MSDEHKFGTVKNLVLWRMHLKSEDAGSAPQFVFVTISWSVGSNHGTMTATLHAWERSELRTKFWPGEVKRKENISIDARIILKRILYIGCVWIRLRYIGGLL